MSILAHSSYLHCYREVRVRLLSGCEIGVTLYKELVVSKDPMRQYSDTSCPATRKLFKSLRAIENLIACKKRCCSSATTPKVYLCCRRERKRTHSAWSACQGGAGDPAPRGKDGGTVWLPQDKTCSYLAVRVKGSTPNTRRTNIYQYCNQLGISGSWNN